MRWLGLGSAAAFWVLTSLACAGSPPQRSAPSVGAPTGGGGGQARTGKRAGGRKAGRGGEQTPAPGGGGTYTVCYAVGIYTTCTVNNGWESCQDQESRAGGDGYDRGTAGAVAIDECTAHMLTMVSIANGGSGSGSIKSSCAVTECSP
jgi:hypothetical protein